MRVSGTQNLNVLDTSNLVDRSSTQTVGGTKTFSNTISGSVSGNSATVTNGVYTTGTQTVNGQKTFSDIVIPTSAPASPINGSIWIT